MVSSCFWIDTRNLFEVSFLFIHSFIYWLDFLKDFETFVTLWLTQWKILLKFDAFQSIKMVNMFNYKHHQQHQSRLHTYKSNQIIIRRFSLDCWNGSWVLSQIFNRIYSFSADSSVWRDLIVIVELNFIIDMEIENQTIIFGLRIILIYWNR